VPIAIVVCGAERMIELAHAEISELSASTAVCRAASMGPHAPDSEYCTSLSPRNGNSEPGRPANGGLPQRKRT
jgi:hypothetical protein